MAFETGIAYLVALIARVARGRAVQVLAAVAEEAGRAGGVGLASPRVRVRFVSASVAQPPRAGIPAQGRVRE